MSDGASRRRYDSPLRQEQAAATRREILDAAEALFIADGYGATSVTAIAKSAGVSPKTVYIAFESKRGVLRALWHLRLRGDEGSAPVGERPWFRAVLDEPNPREKLVLNAGNATSVRARIAPLLEVIRGAASSDPEIAELWSRMQSEFYDNQRTVIESIPRRALKAGLDVDQAADLLWSLNNPVVYQLLVNDRGWTPERYEQWLVESACSQLLR